VNPLTAIRQNHALEHATVAVLLRRYGPLRIIGRSTPGGFYLYGDVPTAGVEEATYEGLRRLQGGESHLAISPMCGTNIAVAGILTGLGYAMSMGRRTRITRLPNAFTATLAALVLSTPAGHLAQKWITTTGDLTGLSIVAVERSGKGKRTIHRVRTQQSR